MNSKPFVGRKTELQLSESYASKTFEAGLASVVFITGELGMGKSELINKFRDKAYGNSLKGSFNYLKN